MAAGDGRSSLSVGRRTWAMFRQLVQMKYGTIYSYVDAETVRAVEDRMDALADEMEAGSRPNVRAAMEALYGEGWDHWNADCPGCGGRVRGDAIADGKCPRCDHGD